MNTYREQDLWMIFKERGNVTVDVVPHNGDDAYTVTFNHFEEAKADIEGLSNENEVYF